MDSFQATFKRKNIWIEARMYDSRQSIAYLDRDLVKRGIQPIEITIQNQTPRTFYLSEKGVSLPTMRADVVARTITKEAIPRSIGLKVASFFFWPLLIPATIDSIVTFKTHINMKADYYAKGIKPEREVLLPYSTVYRIIFVERDRVADSFTLHLQDEKSGRLYPFFVRM